MGSHGLARNHGSDGTRIAMAHHRDSGSEIVNEVGPDSLADLEALHIEEDRC